jgi:hypothetical protein
MPLMFSGLIASLAFPAVIGGRRYTPDLPDTESQPVIQAAGNFYAIPEDETAEPVVEATEPAVEVEEQTPAPLATPAPTPTPAPKPPIARRVAAACAALGIVAYTATACTPHPGIDYRQWAFPATVMSISSICPAATPTTYGGHDPSYSYATDFMLPNGGGTAGDVACGNAIKNWAQHLALIGGWHVHYVCFQQRIWNLQMPNSGWRLMENRGSWTQNHMDHVHVSYW